MSAGWLVALQGDAGTLPGEGDLGLVRVIVGLVVVLVLLAGFLWLLKRGTLATGRGGPQRLAIESAVSLGDRRSLVIVTVEGRRLLLGASQTQVSLIAELGARPTEFGRTLDDTLQPREPRALR